MKGLSTRCQGPQRAVYTSDHNLLLVGFVSLKLRKAQGDRLGDNRLNPANCRETNRPVNFFRGELRSAKEQFINFGGRTVDEHRLL